MCEVAHLCATLCNPVDCSLPGSSIHGIFQPRVLEWVAISFSRGIFLIQGSNPDLSHCRQMLYRLSHQGSNSKKYSLFIWNSNLTQYPLVSWILGFPGSSAGKESACNAGDPTLIPGSCSPWGCKELDMTEQLNWTEWLTLSLSSVKQPGKNYGSEIELRCPLFFMSGGPSNVLYLCSADGLLAGGHRDYACGAHGNFWVFTIPLGAAGKPRGLFLTFPGCSLHSLAPVQCRVLLCVWGFQGWS